MRWMTWPLMIGACALLCWRALGWTRGSADVQAVADVLDRLHEAASAADGRTYFALFADDAVFLGTDASERWPIEEFKAYAAKRFDSGTGWTYRVKDGQRFIRIDEGETIAWFDELLTNEKYGVCRGSGVLRKTGKEWKIVQYNLAMTIPNDIAVEVAKLAAAPGEVKASPGR